MSVLYPKGTKSVTLSASVSASTSALVDVIAVPEGAAQDGLLLAFAAYYSKQCSSI